MLPYLSVRLVCGSYGIYVGKNLTADGSVFLAGYGDEPSSHCIEIVPAREWPPGAMRKVGASAEARYPGELIEIPEISHTAKFITVHYSSFSGFPAPLTNGGLNEHHVAARDVWSPSRDELRKMTPRPQRGLNYSDLSRLVMERARTAREAAKLVGELVDRYGYATYGGNSHLFADRDEGWILIEFAGGKGLWVAGRLGPDEIRVSRPGYIGEVPLDYAKRNDFMGSSNLVSFAIEQGWYDPKLEQPFNVNSIYGDGQMRHQAVADMEKQLKNLAGRITLKNVIAAVRNPDLTRDSAGYGQVAHLRRTPHAELGVLWSTVSTPVASPLVPYHLGVADVPIEFKRHRYLTEGESAKFIDRNWQGVESTHDAFRSFKRLYYLTNEHPAEFLPEVTKAITSFESRLMDDLPDVEKTAQKLFESGEPELARKYLTYFNNNEARAALRLAKALADGIEARTAVQFGIRPPLEGKK